MSYYSNQYGTQQTGAQNVPQQQQQQQQQQRQRQSASQPRYQTSTSAQVSSRSEYPEQSVTVYPSYNNGAPQAQQAYLDPYGAGYATGNPAFPEPHSSPTSGSLQRSPFGQSATQYPSASSSVQRSPSEQSAGHYSSTSSSVQRNYSGQPTTLYAPSSGSVQHSQPATHYPPASSAVQHNYTGQSTTYYPPTQAFDSTNTSYPGSQPAPTSHYGVPHGHGTNASDGSRSSNHLYQTAAPVTHGTLEPPYRGVQPSQERGVASSQPYRQDAYEYDNVDEHRSKGPSAPPVRGPSE
ncbi:hypothetical protein EDB92DRAFT_689431 [Lactarius akahatsu]|uniref:Uncharacterized protein n=1 Tax=Lactarius akahatsu TaxID=416441 RepID=A0AAD4LL81_9AGAM|nr:hypothetical protein EDB92DRAFT_689431 [Lactarius akahatsu]